MGTINKCKFIHILPADTDYAYWFLKMMDENNDDCENHSFLIAANSKTVLKRYTKLMEFSDSLMYLVGGTEGKEAKKRYSHLIEKLNSAEWIIWHGFDFDTIDIVKVLYNKKKLLAKSIWICNTRELAVTRFNDEELNAKAIALDKKFNKIVSALPYVVYNDSFILNRLSNYDIDDDKKIYIPYLLDPDFYKDSQKTLLKLLKEKEELERESELEDEVSEECEYLDDDEYFDDEEEIDIDEDEYLDEEEPEEDTRVKVQFDFGLYDVSKNVACAKILRTLVKEEKIALTIPSEIWLNGIKVVRSSKDAKLLAIFNALFGKKVCYKNASFGIENYYRYLNENVDCVVISSDIIVKPIYLFACIMAGKTFIVQKNNPYYQFLTNLGCNVIDLDKLKNTDELILDKEPTLNLSNVKNYFDVNSIFAEWDSFFHSLTK